MSNLYKLNNKYSELPDVVLINNRIQSLIQFYGEKEVHSQLVEFKNREYFLFISICNLNATYGSEKVLDVYNTLFSSKFNKNKKRKAV